MTIRLNGKIRRAGLALLLLSLTWLAGCAGKTSGVKPLALDAAASGQGLACLRILWTNDQSLMARVLAGLGEEKDFVTLVRRAVEQNPGKAADRLICLHSDEMKPALANLARNMEPGQVKGPVELESGQALVMATSKIHFNRAKALVKAKKWDEAKEELAEDLKLNADNVSSWWLLSLTRLETKDPKGALEAADKGLAWRPQNAPLLNARGAALAGMGQKDAAIASYRLALEYEPDDPLAMNNLAWALTEKGVEPDAALSLAGEAVRLKPDRPEFWDTLGLAQRKKGHYLQAASAYFHALKLDPKNPKLERKLLDCLLELDAGQVEGLWARPGQDAPKPAAKAAGKTKAPKEAAKKAQPAPLAAKPDPEKAASPERKAPIPSQALEGKTLAYPAAGPKPAAVKKTAPAKPAVQSQTPRKKPGRHYVQVASFRAKSLAQKSQARWQRMGYRCSFSPIDLGSRGKWYRVLLGPYPSRNKASHTALDLRRKKAVRSYRLVSLP